MRTFQRHTGSPPSTLTFDVACRDRDRYLLALQAILQHRYCGTPDRIFDCQTNEECRRAAHNLALAAVQGARPSKESRRGTYQRTKGTDR